MLSQKSGRGLSRIPLELSFFLLSVFVSSEPPFHLTRRGWGEFPVRIQIHFKDPRNKRIDIIHQLKVGALLVFLFITVLTN